MPRRKKPTGIRGFGSVYRRSSDGRFVAKYRAEGTKSGYKEEYAHTEEEAHAKLEKAWLAKQQGRLATGLQQTVEQFFEYWLEDVHQGNISYSSYRRYRKLLRNYVLPALGKRIVIDPWPRHSMSCAKILGLPSHLLMGTMAQGEEAHVESKTTERVQWISSLLHRSAFVVWWTPLYPCKIRSRLQRQSHEEQPRDATQIRALEVRTFHLPG